MNAKIKQIYSFFKSYSLIILIILIFSLLFFTLQQQSTLTLWDENVYLSNARGHISENHFEEDFRFPLLEYVIAGIWLITGISLKSAQILMIFFTLATILGTYLISKEIFSKHWKALLTTILFASTSQIAFWSFRVYNDIPALATAIFCIYMLLLANKKKRHSSTYLILFGCLSALTLLFRFPVILISITGFIWWFFNSEKKHIFKNSLIIGISGFVSLVPWLLHNTIKYKHPLWDLFEQRTLVNEYTTWQSSSILWSHIIQTFGIGLFACIPALIRIYKLRNKKIILIASILLIQSIFYFGFVKLKLDRYVLMLSPFIIIILVYGLDEINDWISYIIQKINKNKQNTFAIIKKIILIMCILCIAIPISIHTRTVPQEIHNQAILDSSFIPIINYVNTISNIDDQINSNYWPWFGFYSNTKAHSLWSHNVSELIKGDNTTLIIIRKYHWDDSIDIDAIIEQNTTEVLTTTTTNNQKIVVIRTIK